MGYTQFTKDKLKPYLRRGKMIVDLGSQNDYADKFPAPYISDWYKAATMGYWCIDLNGENGARRHDLGELQPGYVSNCDIVVDAGTSEHVGRNGEFDWTAIYNCWCNKFNLATTDGIIYSENPQTGSWPLHGFNYYTTAFYYQLADHSSLSIIDIGVHAACGNKKDGWNVWCLMAKFGNRFPDLQQFKTFDLRTS